MKPVRLQFNNFDRDNSKKITPFFVSVETNPLRRLMHQSIKDIGLHSATYDSEYKSGHSGLMLYSDKSEAEIFEHLKDFFAKHSAGHIHILTAESCDDLSRITIRRIESPVKTESANEGSFYSAAVANAPELSISA